MCFFLAGFNLISFFISFSVFQGSVLDLLFNSYRACFFRVKRSKDKISIINHMYQLCYLTIVDSEIHGKSKRIWNFLEVIAPQSLSVTYFKWKSIKKRGESELTSSQLKHWIVASRQQSQHVHSISTKWT